MESRLANENVDERPYNRLYYGDNLVILRNLVSQYEHTPFIDIIYIDPPFNSKRNYNILFEDLIKSKQNGEKATALKEAFVDTWSNVSISAELDELKTIDNLKIYNFLTKNRDIFTDDQMSYLTMLSLRIFYMRKLLKDTGSFYLHCDPTMSHYIKILLDMIFGLENYRNEITWQRSLEHYVATTKFDVVTDTIFFYSKNSKKVKFYPVYMKSSTDEQLEKELEKKFPYMEEETGRRFNHQKLEQTSNKSSKDETRVINGKTVTTNLGWRWSQETFDERIKENPRIIYWTKNDKPRYKLYADEYIGKRVSNLWTDFHAIASNANESLGYPTQKPEALLERIITSSTDEGDVIADFFCGCGTTITVAEKLKRKWLGVDINHLAIGLIEEKRLIPLKAKYTVDGFPKDISQAEKLAKEDPFIFEQWVVEYIFKGHSTKKTGDGGYDGHIAFNSHTSKKKIVCLIKINKNTVLLNEIERFNSTIDKFEADIGLFVCFGSSVSDSLNNSMIKYANKLEKLDVGADKVPRLTIIKVEDFIGKEKNLPIWLNLLLHNITY